MFRCPCCNSSLGWRGSTKPLSNDVADAPPWYMPVQPMRMCPSCGARLKLETHWSAWLVTAAFAAFMVVVIVVRIQVGKAEFHNNFPLLSEFVYICPLLAVLCIRALSHYVPLRGP
jgi:uncharacterized protein (DUF983 family)